MYYFYYFQDTQTGLYYGGITDNIARRQNRHQKQLNNNLKSDKKPWHLFQDKIQLITLWFFNTKKEACVYEKQWIINNYLNPLCLNCSVSNSEYNYNEHQALCEKSGGFKSKVRYALEVNSPGVIHTFNSVYKADLARKFKSLSQVEIKGNCNRPFILINKFTKEQSQIFYGVYEPQALNYKIQQSSLSQCLLGNRRTANGYYVTLCI